VDKAGQRDKLPTFCAVQRTRIPVIVDEVSNIVAMRTEISELRKRFEAVADQMNEIMLKQSVESWPPLSHAMGVGARQTEVIVHRRTTEYCTSISATCTSRGTGYNGSCR